MSERQFHFLKNNVPRGPVGLDVLVTAVIEGKLHSGDYIKEEGEHRWVALDDATWLHEAADRKIQEEQEAGLRAMAEKALGVSSNQPPVPRSLKRRRTKSAGQNSGRQKWVIAGLCLLLAAGLFGVGYLLIGGQSQAGAKSYLSGELGDWRAGRDSDAVRSMRPNILVDYEIVRVEPIDDLQYDEESAYLFTVQLTFTTGAGGEPVELHHFRVYWSKDEEEWKISSLTAYLALLKPSCPLCDDHKVVGQDT